MQQFSSEKQAVAKVREVGVDAKFPGVAEGADHFRFLREVLVFAVFNVTAIDEGLKIGTVADTVRRINVNHLNLPTQALFFEERIHDEKRISGDEAVGPAVRVTVEIDGFAKRRIFLARFEQVALRGL